MIVGEGPSEGKRAAPPHARGIARALVLCQTYGMAEILGFIVHTFQTLWVELVTFFGEKPLIAGIVAAGFLLAIAVPELRYQRRTNREATR